MGLKVDTRVFTHAGSTNLNGTYKARFANHPAIRTNVLTNEGHTEIVLVELPKPMNKLDAIAWLKANKPEGVNQDSLVAKENYINTQLETIVKQNTPKPVKVAKVPSGRHRGRPPLSPEVKAARLAEKEAAKAVKVAAKALKNSLPKVTLTKENPKSNPVVASIVATAKKARTGSIRAKAVAAVTAANTVTNTK
jgi:hypothetical protein